MRSHYVDNSPSIQSVATASSLDLDQSFADIQHDTSLLTESLSFSDSVSVISTDSVAPPFPLGCMIPMSSILAAKPRLSGDPNATLTVPTPPRLRTLLKESMSVKRWTENLLVNANAPGHTPWGELDEEEGAPWVPEGSIYSPDEFKTSLSTTRSANDRYKSPVLPPESPVAVKRSTNSHRDALVFEREITLKADGRTRRWSVQVPATNLNPEVADIMLQLRDLNTYFSHSNNTTDTIPEEGDALSEEEDATPDEDEDEKRNNIPPPSLIVSTSQFTMPLSLESVSNLEPAAPSKSLASRRQRNLPQLTLDNTKLKDIIYPGIPTAFLGSSSDYTPLSDVSRESQVCSESMNLQDMIGTLRSKCASLQVHTPASADFSQQQIARNLDLITPANLVLGSDDWAFAESLNNEFLPDVPDSACDVTLSEPNPLDDSLLDETLVASPILLDSPAPLPRPSSTPMDPNYLPPTSPLPPCPSPTNSPRGILKRCKSVRFASEDEAEEIVSDTVKPPAEPLSQRPRHSTGSALSAKRLPAVRHTYAPKCVVIPPQNMSPSKTPPAFLSAAGRRKPSHYPLAPPPRAMSTPPVVDRRQTITPHSRSPTKASAARSQPPIPQVAPLPVKTRHSMLPTSPTKARPGMGGGGGRPVVDKPSVIVFGGKENSRQAEMKAGMKSRFTMDENALRRGHDVKEVRKSRVPMPLRNILTRFK